MYDSKERYQLHWVMIGIGALQTLKDVIFPVALLFGINMMRDGVKQSIIPILIMLFFFTALLFVSFLTSYIRWKRFVYWFEDDELRMEYGLFVRKKRYIPFERIQSLDFTESIFHRPLVLVKINIETASGSGEAEASLAAVSKEAAHAIEVIVREGKKKVIVQPQLARLTEDGMYEEMPSLQEERVVEKKREAPRSVFKMSSKDLLILATTSGGIGVILSGLLLFFSQFSDLIPLEWLAFQMREFIQSGITFVVLVIGVILLIAWLLSVGWTFLSYARFEVKTDGENIFITRGLIEKKRVTVPLKRVQSVELVENPFRQLFGLCTVTLHSAGGVGDGERLNLFPLVRKKDVYEPLRRIIPGYTFDEPTRKMPKRGRHFFRRLRYVWILPVIVGMSYYFYPYGLLTLLLVPLNIAYGWWQHRSAGYDIVDQQLILRTRSLTLRTMYVQKHRIQSMTWRQSYFHGRKEIGTLEVYIKSGMFATVAQAPFIDHKEGERLFEWYAHSPRIQKELDASHSVE